MNHRSIIFGLQPKRIKYRLILPALFGLKDSNLFTILAQLRFYIRMNIREDIKLLP